MRLPTRTMIRVAGVLPAAVALALVLLPPNSLARPKIRQAFFDAYPGAVGSRLDDVPSHPQHCGVCHYNFAGGGTRNPYGQRLGNVIGGFPNTDQGRRLAVLSIENEDSEGDGYSTLTEVTDIIGFANTPTFPGLDANNVGGVSNVNVGDILGYLVPQAAGDVTPPQVNVTSPNGGESWTGGSSRSVTWTATDNVTVVSVDIFYRDGESAPWTPIARGMANTGSFTWFVHNTPTSAARVRVVARDPSGNQGSDQSDNPFTIVRTPGGVVPTTLRDFHQPGSQPHQGAMFEVVITCGGCHGYYNPAVEPLHNFVGSMMSQAARDPLFYACLAIAEQDAPSSGDLCLRCHSPFAWLGGRSQPTDGSRLNAQDREGVACDFCHRLVDPVYKPGVSPPEDLDVLNGLMPAHVPTTYSNGQYVVDNNPRKRGPFGDPVTPHDWINSAFHRSAELCGTCHDVSNPVFVRTGGADYAPGPFDQAADSISSLTLMPLERTYSEWKNSAYPAGVYAPEFAGNKPDGIVSKCQDCHMRDVLGAGCGDVGVPVRPDLPLHDMTGGSAWLGPLIATLYPSETDPVALAAGAARAVTKLQKAALLDVAVEAQGDSFRADVTVTNRTGHKLPTGYPEGRRMWLHVVARDAANQVVYESGGYDPTTGVLSLAGNPVIYEVHLGLSPALAKAIGLPSGKSFHFTLNDTIVKDNRIPPLGFTNAAFQTFGGVPVDPDRPGTRYADGQNWDTSSFRLPPTARRVTARLLYQSTSKEYIEFLRDENFTNSAGLDLYDLWAANGRAAPVEMQIDSMEIAPVSVPIARRDGEVFLSLGANPFRERLEMRLELGSPARVALEVYDVAGRRVARTDWGSLAAGAHRLRWDGRDDRGRNAGAGAFWARVSVDERRLVRRVIKLQ